MASVGIRALQQHASDVVRRSAAGETVDITDRGRPVARLVPYGGSLVQQLAAAGQLRAARTRLGDQPPPLPAAEDGPTLSELLTEAREQER